MSSQFRRRLLNATIRVVLVGLAFGLPAPTPARGAPAGLAALALAVNSPSDIPDVTPGDGVCETALNNHVCTLRGAVQEANAHAGADSIALQAGTTYLLSRVGSDGTALNGDLDITDSVTIEGDGPSSTIIDGNSSLTADRVFQITGTVVISGVTILHGQTGNQGGGINNAGQLTIINSRIISNTAAGSVARGGGLYNSGALTLTNSTVQGNQTGSNNPLGGGILSDGPLTLINSTVSGNKTPGIGGGIVGSGMLINSTVSGNTSGDRGGGIFKELPDLILINSTVSGNFSAHDGGGIYVGSGTTSLFNVTITGNWANISETVGNVGGGVANAGGTLNFANSIIALNETIRLPGPFLDPSDCSGALTSQGNNLVATVDSLHCTITGPFTLADPLLGPLQDNGGPTLTHALLLGSPAIDAGNAGGCTDSLGGPLTTDQRGRGRPLAGHGRCDIGAFEFPYLVYLPLVQK